MDVHRLLWFPIWCAGLRYALLLVWFGVFVFAFLILSGAPAVAAPPATAPPAGHQPAGEAAVLAAMDRYMAAISSSDLATIAAMQMPEGTTFRARRTPEGGNDIVARPNRYWSDPARADGRTYRERYWSPTVLIRGGIAVVWAPYEFWIDGETSHCGIDVFDFVQVDGQWRVANAMWTVETEACAELRPAPGTVLRPAG